MKSYQASQRRNLDRAAASFFKVETDQITQCSSRKKIEDEKRIKREQNAKKLKEYMIEVRRTYDGDVLAYIEENVFKMWERHHYTRAAYLAHFDIDKAIIAHNLKRYIVELRQTYSDEVLSYIEENVVKKWEMDNYSRPIDLAHDDVEKAVETFSKSTI